MECSPALRTEFLTGSCKGDDERRRGAESPLAQASGDGLLDRPAADLLDSTAPPLPLGAQLGPYRIVSKLGEGGMGVVYRAHDERLNRQVALKTLREATIDGIPQRRLWREARVAAALNHPAICQLYDVGEDHGQLYLVMELLEGESLAQRISRGPLELPLAIQMTLSILGALEVLHRKDLIHRDLKPSNIFLTPHGIKLLDFGLARKMAMHAGNSGEPNDIALTKAGTITGTPSYLAPEQLAGDEPDSRADLFAAGAILFEMLAGRRAFAGSTMAAIFHAVVYEQPPVLAGSAAISAADLIVRRALAKKPEDRYQTAQAMADDLRAAMLREGTAAPAHAHAITRLIVLPFRMLRPDPEFEFLAFSLPDAITNSLSGLTSLVVRSSMVASKYAGQSSDLKLLATEAEVDVVLTGTVLRGGDELRVMTQLAKAPEGAVIWSQTSQLGLRDIFQLQDEIVRRVVESLALPLTGREARSLQHDVPVSPIAYEYYLRANQLSMDWRHYHTARDLYLKCVEMDPNYAPAWARLARCCRVIARMGGDDQDVHRAEAAFRQALDLNPELNIAHGLYALVEADAGRAPQAMVRLLQRTRNNGNDPNLFSGLVVACRFCGLLNASIAAHQHARRLDPLIPTSVSLSYFMAGDYQQCHDNSGSDNFIRALALEALGREEEALEIVRKDEAALELLLTQERASHHQLMYWVTSSLRALFEGKQEESFRALERTKRWRKGEEMYHDSRQLARLGELEEAVNDLEQAVQLGFICYPAMVRDPWLDPLRADPHFTTILREVQSRHEDARKMFMEAGGMQILGAL